MKITLSEAKKKYKFCKINSKIRLISEIIKSDLFYKIIIVEEKPISIEDEWFKKLYLYVPGFLNDYKKDMFPREIKEKYNDFVSAIEKSEVKMYVDTNIIISDKKIIDITKEELEQSYIDTFYSVLKFSQKNYVSITFGKDNIFVNTTEPKLSDVDYIKFTEEDKKIKSYNYNTEYKRVIEKYFSQNTPDYEEIRNLELLSKKIIELFEIKTAIKYKAFFSRKIITIFIPGVPHECEDYDLGLNYKILNKEKINWDEFEKLTETIELLVVGEYPGFEIEETCEISLIQK